MLYDRGHRHVDVGVGAALRWKLVGAADRYVIRLRYHRVVVGMLVHGRCAQLRMVAVTLMHHLMVEGRVRRQLLRGVLLLHGSLQRLVLGRRTGLLLHGSVLLLGVGGRRSLSALLQGGASGVLLGGLRGAGRGCSHVLLGGGAGSANEGKLRNVSILQVITVIFWLV